MLAYARTQVSCVRALNGPADTAAELSVCGFLKPPLLPPCANFANLCVRVWVAVGGVTKEWFQLLIRELFQPAFGMFEYVEETREVWLSPAASHIGVSKADFRMVGIVLGLAIFNGVILDAHFPLVRTPRCQLPL